jgi:hypothetical protein
MNLLTNTLDSLGQVLLVGLVLGAGLPALFALGLRLLNVGHPTTAERPHPWGVAAAVGCFAVVSIAIVAGLLLITQDFIAQRFGFDVF